MAPRSVELESCLIDTAQNILWCNGKPVPISGTQGYACYRLDDITAYLQGCR